MFVLALDIGFLPFRIFDLLDITLVALLLFIVYKLVKGSIALNISIGIASVFFIWWLVRALDMRLISGILGQFIEVGVIALLIVFQQEIRRVLLIIGRNTSRYQKTSSWFKYLPWNWTFDEDYNLNINEITKATAVLSSEKIGGLIIISRNSDLKNFSNTGVEIRALVKSELLISIFNKESPIHDGAVIIASNILVAASCILPVTQNPDLPRQYGLRHRAAIGLTEQTDAIAIVISEENGGISISKDGKIYAALTPEELTIILTRDLRNKKASSK